MRRAAALALAGTLIFTAPPSVSQTSASTMLVPSPLSLVLTVGRWLMESDQTKVYYIRVQGRGLTESEARREAYKRATEEAIGSLVLSESVVVDQQRQRREIIEYSSGFVDRSKTLDTRVDGRYIVVDMDVWIRHSAIADRLLVESRSTKTVDGLRIQQQVETLNYERSQGLRILSVVMDDYPKRAFDVSDQALQVLYNGRNVDIVVEFSMKFNRSYLYALWETLKTVAQNANPGNCYPGCREPYQIYMTGQRDRFLFNRWDWSFGFTEVHQPDVVHAAMLASQPGVLVTIKDDSGRALYAMCHFWSELDGEIRFHYPQRQFVRLDHNRILIDGTFSHRARVEIRDFPEISRARTVDLAVVRQSGCPR